MSPLTVLWHLSEQLAHSCCFATTRSCPLALATASRLRAEGLTTVSVNRLRFGGGLPGTSSEVSRLDCARHNRRHGTPPHIRQSTCYIHCQRSQEPPGTNGHLSFGKLCHTCNILLKITTEASDIDNRSMALCLSVLDTDCLAAF